MSEHTKGISSPCIPWTGAIDEDGYGRVNVDGKWKMAHRVAYERAIGTIQIGMVIDHLCRKRDCCNPLHMEPVSNAENVLRGEGITAINAGKMFCKRGHRLSGENLRLTKRGRSCKECARRRWREYRERKISTGEWSRS